MGDVRPCSKFILKEKREILNLTYTYALALPLRIRYTIRMSVTSLINYQCKCERCLHSWRTRTEDVPKVCPKCKSTNWNESKDQSNGKPVPVAFVRVTEGGQAVRQMVESANALLDSDICETCGVDTFETDHKTNCKYYSGVVIDR